MNDIADHDRILQGNPWIFRNSWLVVKHGIGRWIITLLTLSMFLFGYNYGAFLFIVEPNRWGKV
jgi:hypothetical protein